MLRDDREFTGPLDRTVHRLEASVLAIGLAIVCYCLVPRVGRLLIHGDPGFGGLIYTIPLVVAPLVVAGMYGEIVYLAGRVHVGLRLALDGAVIAAFVLVVVMGWR